MSEQKIQYGEPVQKDPRYQYIIWYNKGCESTLKYNSKEYAEKDMLAYVKDLEHNGCTISHITLIVFNDVAYEVQIT
jgi:hypothetical protein